MATYSEKLRQGLPRTPGGEPWPVGGVPAGTEAVVTATSQAPPAETPLTDTPPAVTPTPAVETAPVPTEASAPDATPQPAGKVFRQGLPRVPGGEPWPAGGQVAGGAASVAALTDTPTPSEAVVSTPVEAPVAQAESAEPEVAPAAETAFVLGDVPLRRGLPRTPGGEPWPAEGFAPTQAAKTVPSVSEPAQQVADAVVAETSVAEPAVAETPAEAPTVQEPEVRPTPPAAPQTPAKPAATQPAASAAKPAKPKREPIMLGEKSLAQWIKLVVLGGIGAIVVAAILVLAARGLTTFTVVSDFIARFPGEYGLPDSSEPGFPWWARWSHFLNIFLMVLIIRSGILVRTQQKPPAFWTPKKGGKKISINLWLHTSLDVLWLVNGVIFVVLLFVSNHWMRIVPTSWEVFPNALSAMIQYATLDWPVENGWVNYNSIQQLMYFTVVFIAAPLATITGLRMSEWWPEKAEKLNKIYPAPLARALHFPTMLFFVLFILIHVFLVFSTGALKNLNHMFAGTEVVNWTGFWLFALAIFLTAAGWFAARPLVLAPIANLFGKVSNR